MFYRLVGIFYVRYLFKEHQPHRHAAFLYNLSMSRDLLLSVVGMTTQTHPLIKQIVFYGEDGGLYAVTHSQLAENIGNVILHGTFADN